ncbi:MAG: cytochrome c [Pseudomonadota bacterium]
MKPLTIVLAVAALSTSVAAFAGDPVVGRQKAAACVACHGNETFTGIFYTLQLGGRNADKLAIKTNKYKTGKILHPVMNMATAFYSEKDIEDVAAYYQSLGKPAFVPPFVQIKGDDEAPAATTVSAK